MNVIVINTTGVLKNWGGLDVDPFGEYSLQEVDRIRLLSDSTFLTDLNNGIAVINDGEYNLSVRVAIGILQYNPIIMAEYYTLVQGDDVLIGNGQILFLNDDSWESQEDLEEEDVED